MDWHLYFYIERPLQAQKGSRWSKLGLWRQMKDEDDDGDELQTWMVEQRLVLTLLDGGDQVPDEALDLLITFVVSQAVHQQSSTTLESQLNVQQWIQVLTSLTDSWDDSVRCVPADDLHVPLSQVPLEATVIQDVLPPSPPWRHRAQGVMCILWMYLCYWVSNPSVKKIIVILSLYMSYISANSQPQAFYHILVKSKENKVKLPDQQRATVVGNKNSYIWRPRSWQQGPLLKPESL